MFLPTPNRIGERIEMAYLIHFADGQAVVRTYEKVTTATIAAEALPKGGPRFIIADVTLKSLNILTLPLLQQVIQTHDPDADLPDTKPEAITAALPAVTALATPGVVHSPEEEEMENQEEGTEGVTDISRARKGKKAAKAKKGAKAAASKGNGKAARAKASDGEEGGRGKTSPMAGKKIVKTQKGNEARRKEGTRRSEGWAAFKSGQRYEAVVAAGVAPADLNIMLKLGHIKAE